MSTEYRIGVCSVKIADGIKPPCDFDSIHLMTKVTSLLAPDNKLYYLNQLIY